MGKIKDANASSSTGYNFSDHKFSRVPSLTRIVAVRSNAFGAYAAVRKDCDVLQAQTGVDNMSLWSDLHPLLPLQDLSAKKKNADTEDPAPRFWVPAPPAHDSATIRRAILQNPSTAWIPSSSFRNKAILFAVHSESSSPKPLNSEILQNEGHNIPSQRPVLGTISWLASLAIRPHLFCSSDKGAGDDSPLRRKVEFCKGLSLSASLTTSRSCNVVAEYSGPDRRYSAFGVSFQVRGDG